MTQNTSSTNILIIEDEIAIAEGLVDLCELNGYRVKHVVDGESGLAEALSGQYGLVLLDLMLPGMDGFTVCDKIREKDKSLPIIILSAKNSDDDIINGLKFGADDYIPKPFSVPMLLARIEAVLRRSRQTMENEGKLVAGNLRVNFREYTGVRGTEELAFTRKEIEILEYLWNNRDHAIPRSELLRKVWGYENAESVDTRTVDIHITKLRKKIEDDPAHPKLLVTFRGEGYQMRSAPRMREVRINKLTTYLSSKFKSLRKLVLASKDRLIFVAIFIVIAIPVIVLLSHSYAQLQTSSLFGYKEHAFSVLQNVNKNITADLAIEDRRSYADYRFIRAVPVFGGEEITMSELAEFPQRSHYVGLVGHFQLDPSGNLSTPVLPDGVLESIPMVDKDKRVAIRNKIGEILNTSGFSAISSATTSLLSSSSVENGKDTTLKNDSRLIDQIYKQDFDIASLQRKKKSSKSRVEQITKTGDFAFGVESTKLDTTGLLVRLINTESTHSMEVEIDFFQAIVDSSYIIFHRTVRRGPDVFIQGFIVDARVYLTNLVKNEIEKYKGVTKGNQQDPLVLAFFHKNKSFVAFGERNNITTELLSEKLQAPLSDITFKMFTTQKAPGGEFVIFIGLLMLAVLAIGLISIYHVTQSRMKLAAKRQDFVSAITHELKTPLTAIKMYAELLQSSWVANEEKKQKYYGQIASEADRLSRLIQNVLNLSKLDGNRWNVQLRMAKPKSVLDDFVSTYSKNVEKQGFSLTVSSDTDADNISLMIDRDAIMQILMNLVDNSLKFSKTADYKMINVELRIKDTDMYLAVRDYGPGIPPSEMKKVFQEFYRVENEMTRQTSGTGIGLSMVKKLCTLCNMTIEIENANPGLRTKIHFPSLSI